MEIMPARDEDFQSSSRIRRQKIAVNPNANFKKGSKHLNSNPSGELYYLAGVEEKLGKDSVSGPNQN